MTTIMPPTDKPREEVTSLAEIVKGGGITMSKDSWLIALLGMAIVIGSVIASFSVYSNHQIKTLENKIRIYELEQRWVEWRSSFPPGERPFIGSFGPKQFLLPDE